MNLLFSALVVVTILLTGCSGSSPEFGATASGTTPGQRHQVPTRTLGPAGQRKEGQYVWVRQKFVIPPGIGVDVEAECPLGYVVIGGGYDVESGTLHVTATKPNLAFDRWIVSGKRNFSEYIKVTVFASCVA